MVITCPRVVWADSSPTPRGVLAVIRVVTRAVTKLVLVLLNPPRRERYVVNGKTRTRTVRRGLRLLGRSVKEMPGALQCLIEYALKEHGAWTPVHLREGG